MSAQVNRVVDGRPLYWKRRWERGFAALRKFRAREGHCCPSRRYVEGGFNLGQWVSVQRYHKGLLSTERKRRLDAIGFVWETIFGNNISRRLKTSNAGRDTVACRSFTK
jgi:hypothetical protein